MNLAEVREHDLRSEPQRARAARVEPGRRIARHLRLGGIEAERGQRRENVGLGVEEAGGLGLAVPMAAGTTERRRSGAHAGGDQLLILRRVAAVGLADLEQRHVGEAAIAVALTAASRPGSRLGRIDDISVEIGLASSSASAPPPKCVAWSWE